MRRIVLITALLCLVALPAAAQDPVKVDPNHYKVVFENAQVRVLKFHYGPHEKSVMHSHPNLVFIPTTDGHARFTLPNGKTEERSMKTNEPGWEAATVHNPENLSDQPMEGILIEMKSKGPAKPAAKKPTM